MKNIKRVILRSIVIFFTLICPYSYGYICETQLKAIDATITTLSGSVEKASSQVAFQGLNKLSASLENSAAMLNKPAETLVGGAEKITKTVVGTAAPIGQGVVVVGGILACGYAATQIYSIGKDIHSHFNPSAEQKANTIEANKKYRSIKTEIDLEDCFIANFESPKNASGRPVVCEHIAKMFSVMQGAKRLDEKTNDFVYVSGK